MKLTRLEKAWELMQEVAQKGKFGLRLELFQREAPKMEEQLGVKVKRVSPIIMGKAWYDITWLEAFNKEGMDYKQAWYMSYIIDELPPCETPAQELFLLSGRNKHR